MSFALVVLLQLAGTFDVCESEFAGAEDPRSAYMCFYFTSQNESAWDEGVRRTEALLERTAEPDRRHWLELVLAHIHSERNEEAAEASYRTAAAGFAERGVDDGEVLARNNLTRILQRQRRHAEAESEIERVLEVAERSGDPALIARARISEADYLTANGREVARAYRALKRAEEVAFPDGSRGLKRRVLSGLGQVAFATGRLDESIDAYQRLLTVLEGENDLFAASMIEFNVAMAKYRQLQHLPSASGRDEVLRLAGEALSAALGSENRRAEAFARQLLVELTPRSEERIDAIRTHAERCLEVAQELGHPDRIVGCSLAAAEFYADVDGQPADARLSEALDMARDVETNWYTAYAWRTRARIGWRMKSFDEAVADARAALEAVEYLRRLQDEAQGRVELFSDWTQDYYTLSGRLLEAGDVAEAFLVTERMRARTLLESLEASAMLPERPDDPAHEGVLRAIAGIQRRLLDPGLEGASRREALAELERLELDEAELRAADETLRALEPGFVPLEALQSSLDAGQAVLSFQVGLWTSVHDEPGGGAWLVVITKDDARAFRLPGRVELTPKVPVFVGLVARRDGSEAPAATRLYQELVAEAVESLPDGVNELVILPDGMLHHLPFAALRAESGESLGERYALSVAPSATLWHRWRENAAASAPVPVLALADPELPAPSAGAGAGAGAGVGVAEERGVFLREGVVLGALPHARREGKSIVELMGGESELLVADEASEQTVKALDASRYRVLHFAAHALADDENPDRSAVLLSPGVESEDGLLQSREISRLELDGSIVVLSACQTASGRTFSGEGVLSLARAFFRAGAHAVVASRWPLRDDEAAELFDGFYAALSRGSSLSEAMREATTRAIDEDMPSAVWSGVTVYGNGALMAVDSPTGGGAAGQSLLIALAVAIAFGVALLIARSLAASDGNGKSRR